ncbi:hypothetical protein HOY80DRAFT_1068455 [Tuber brumale]|nr:hypothetical protein HOY80DRAFT_1068455 [Tuber brumale]
MASSGGHMQGSAITRRARQSPTGPDDYLQGPAVTCRARPSPAVTGRNLAHPTSLEMCRARPSVPGILPCTAVRPVRARRRTDWMLGFTARLPSVVSWTLLFPADTPLPSGCANPKRISEASIRTNENERKEKRAEHAERVPGMSSSLRECRELFAISNSYN